MQHAQQEVLEGRGNLWSIREAQRLILDHLEELEDVGRIEGDAPEDKRIEAGTQRIDVRRPAPVMKHSSASAFWHLCHNFIDVAITFWQARRQSKRCCTGKWCGGVTCSGSGGASSLVPGRQACRCIAPDTRCR